MRKVQQMQREMQKTQEEIANTEFTTTNGVVTITMNGEKSLKEVKFEEGFMPEDQEDLEMISGMIVAAAHQAEKEIDDFTKEKMQKYQALLGGFGF